MWSQNSIADLKAWIDIGYIPSSPRTAKLTACLFTPNRAFANLIWTFTGNIHRYFDSKSTLLFTIFSDQISLQYTRIGLTHVSKSLRWVEILDFSDIKSCLIQNKDLVAFLHNISTAFVKIPEGLEIIPKYLYKNFLWSTFCQLY